MRYFIFTFLLIGLTISISAQDSMSSEWKTKSTKQYIVSYPTSWDFDDSGLMGTSFIIMSQQESPEDLFRENVNYSSQDLSEYNMNLDQFVALSEQQLFQMITDANLISSERISHQGKDMHTLVYTGKQGQYALQFYQLFWLDTDIAYVLTFTSEIDQYEKYYPTGTKIIKQFAKK